MLEGAKRWVFGTKTTAEMRVGVEMIEQSDNDDGKAKKDSQTHQSARIYV